MGVNAKQYCHTKLAEARILVIHGIVYKVTFICGPCQELTEKARIDVNQRIESR